jgi:glycosyltransferase involved in cell wall biosynthesis
MKELPLISVILCVYNAEPYLAEAIESIKMQDYKNIEIVAINDGSRDKSSEVIKRYPEIILKERAELGESKTRNEGIRESHGDYIAFLDPDDVYYPGRLSRQLEQLESNPEMLMNTSLCRGFLQAGLKKPTWVRESALGVPHKNMSPSGWLMRRSIFARLGYLDETINGGCDFEWVKRVIQSGVRLGLVEEVLWGKRIHAQAASAFVDQQKVGRYYHELLTVLKRPK